MIVPILKQGEYLIASIQSALSDNDLLALRDALVEKVVALRIRGVIIDVTALDVLDSFASRTLRDVAHMVRLRGAQTLHRRNSARRRVRNGAARLDLGGHTHRARSGGRPVVFRAKTLKESA